MQLNDIRKIVRHCYTRETELTPESAFRFNVILGAKKTHVPAKYPAISQNQEADSDGETVARRRRKGKERQQEDLPALDGLLQIDRGNRTPSPEAGPSNRHNMVRIGMNDMLKLRRLGYEVVGPVNGPNEGPPEYVVPERWMDDLKSQAPSQPSPIPTEARLSPIDLPTRTIAQPQVVDPSLFEENPTNEQPNNSLQQSVPDPEQSDTRDTVSQSDTVERPTTSIIFAPEPERPKTPESRLLKRSRAARSPQTPRQTRSMSKKNKQSHDDVLPNAMPQDSGKKGKRRPTRRHK